MGVGIPPPHQVGVTQFILPKGSIRPESSPVFISRSDSTILGNKIDVNSMLYHFCLFLTRIPKFLVLPLMGSGHRWYWSMHNTKVNSLYDFDLLFHFFKHRPIIFFGYDPKNKQTRHKCVSRFLAIVMGGGSWRGDPPHLFQIKYWNLGCWYNYCTLWMFHLFLLYILPIDEHIVWSWKSNIEPYHWMTGLYQKYQTL